MGRLMDEPSPSPVPASCSAPVWGKDPAWEQEQPLMLMRSADVLVSTA